MRGIFRQKAQGGRTVVEMLAFLAIAGVLSIGGIMTYKVAVQLFREAETVDAYSVTVAGGRTWPIVDHYGSKIKKGTSSATTQIVPIREVVSRVNYSNVNTFEWAVLEGVEKEAECKIVVDEDGVEAEVCNDADVYYSKREYESFDALTLAPVFVRAENSCAWSVRIVGLSNKLCKDIARKRTLGYDYIYRAKTLSNGMPEDPSWNDFGQVTHYSNEDISVDGKLEALCASIDPSNSTKPLVQQYYEQMDDAGFSEVAQKSGMRQMLEGKRLPVRHLAKDARVKVKDSTLPLQTLVLYFDECGTGGNDVPDPPCIGPHCYEPPVPDSYSTSDDSDSHCCDPGVTPYEEAKGFKCPPKNYFMSATCCNAIPGMIWINWGGVDVDCCEVDSNGKLTRKNWEGKYTNPCNEIPACSCVEDTPWLQTPVGKTCQNVCPPSLEAAHQSREYKKCCEGELHGKWHTRPGMAVQQPLPVNGSPADTNTPLCCWAGGSGKVTVPLNSTSNSTSAHCPWQKQSVSTTTPQPGTGGSDSCNADALNPYDIYKKVNTDCCATINNNGTYAMQPYTIYNSQELSPKCCEALPPPSGSSMIYKAVADTSCKYECCEAIAPSDFESPFLNWQGNDSSAYCCNMVENAKLRYKSCCEVDLAYDSSDTVGVWVKYTEQNPLTYTVKNPCPSDPANAEKYICETVSIAGTEGTTCCETGLTGHDITGAESILCCPPGGDDTEICCPLKPGYTWNDTTQTCEQCVDNCDIPGECDTTKGYCRYGKVLEEDEEVRGTYCVGTKEDQNVCCQTAALGFTDAGVFNPACCSEKDCVFVPKSNITPIDCRTGNAISAPSNPPASGTQP